MRLYAHKMIFLASICTIALYEFLANFSVTKTD